jgi:HlyD family secretion protein
VRIRFHREARTTPDTVDGLKVPYAAAKRNAPKWRWWLILAAVASPALYLAFTTARNAVVLSADGTVMLEQHQVRAGAAGQLVELHVQPGALVAKGELVARIHDANLEASIEESRARLSAAAKPPRKVTGSRDQGLRAELALQHRVLAAAEERAAAIKELFANGAATAAELREALAASDHAAASVVRLEDQLASALRLEGQDASGSADAATMPETRGVPDPELRRLLAAREQLTIRSEVSGRVLEVHAAKGEFVGAGAPLFSVGNDAAPEVIAYLSPESFSKLKVGAEATIRFPDGAKSLATVVNRPMMTQRVPAELVDRFGLRPTAVVLHLMPHDALPDSRRIHGLPVSVRFHYSWEPTLQPVQKSQRTVSAGN